MLARAVRKIRDRWEVARDPVGYARRIGVTVGERCLLIGIGPATFGSDPHLVSLGDHVALASGVRFITHDGGAWVFRDIHPSIDIFGRIDVYDNVMVGLNAIVLPGVEIGPDAVVAAGAVVSRTVPPGTVVGGVPARVLCSIEQYEAAVLPRAMHIAHLPTEERYQILCDSYPPPAPGRRRSAGHAAW